MIIYEVNLLINKKIVDAYKKWLSEHVKDMLSFEGFLDAKIFSNLLYHHELQEALIIHYTVDSIANLERYFTFHADSMRQKGTVLFGDQFKAERRILKMEYL